MSDLREVSNVIRQRAAMHRAHANRPCTDPGFWRARAADLEWAADLVDHAYPEAHHE